MAEHGRRDAGSVGRLDRLHDEHPGGAGRRRFCKVDEDLAAARQVRGIAHGDRGRILVLVFEHVDPDDSGRKQGSRGRRVVDVIGARRLALDVQHAALRVGSHLDLGGRRDLRQREVFARRVDVVDEQLDRRRLAREQLHVVGVRDGLDRADRPHVEAQLGRRHVGAVRDRHIDRERALVGRQRSVGDLAVSGEVDLVALGGRDVRGIDVVAVGVDPIGQHVVRHRAAGLDRDRGAQILLRGREVLFGVVHAQIDACGVGSAAPVAHRVAEGAGSAGVLRHRDLQRLAVLDRLHLARAGLLVDRDREHVAVGIRVVVEHGEHRRPTRAHTVVSSSASGSRFSAVRSGG